MPLHPGEMIGQYRLLERIGAGGMGQVFKAIHPTMQRLVAVKIMAPNLVQDARARARFMREVRSAARLSHPNIVMAYDAAEEAGRCFLVMEYVEGNDAAALLHQSGPPPVAVACEIIRQAALGLQHAHEMGMLHRDVKPGNLVIAARRTPPRDGSAGSSRPARGWPTDPLVKVLDFGLARLQASAADASVHVPGSTPLTREGHVVGTPEFMAPEQACNSGTIDIRADVYGLGCTFYALLTGQPPFTAPSLLEIMVKHLQSPLPPVTQSRSDVPAGVVAVLERMLAKRAEDRYQTPGEVAEALLPWIAAPAGAVEAVAAAAVQNVSPDTGAGGHPALPTVSHPGTPQAPPPPTEPLSQPGVIDRAVTATSRSFFGCFCLFLVLLASMIVGGFLMVHFSSNAEPPAGLDGPRPGPVSGMQLVRFPAGHLVEPTYGPAKSLIDIPRDFELSQTEVTQDQFRLFVKAKGYRTSAELGVGERGPGAWLRKAGSTEDTWSEGATWDTWRTELPGDLPVTCVSWEDAVAFCNWLSEKEHLTPCYQPLGGPQGGWDCKFQATGYRLPTEAEWEYAARDSDQRLYPSPRDVLLQHGWFLENAEGQPHPVGGKTGTRRDLSDVWGNVWEWCWDHQPAIVPRTAPTLTGPENGDKRVVRGGSWADPAPQNAAATRRAFLPDHRANDLGFRVARTLPR
jgi:serine/threonine protein kinase